MLTMTSFLKACRQRLRAAGKTNGEIFDAIYRKGGWVRRPDASGTMSSGEGSEAAVTEGYEQLVVDTVRREGFTRIVDIGCGDYQVGRRILEKLGDAVDYTGIDVSSLIVQRNTELYTSHNVRFLCLDATADPLPDGDIILAREVLQHLSNADIFRIIPAIRRYNYNIVTNTVRLHPSAHNIDIASGATSRAGLGHGLWLDRPPFSLKVTELGRWRHGGVAAPTELISVRVEG